MNDPRWTTVEAALERDPQERAWFLREACAGNETLRREVESLLAHAKAEDFLHRPAHDVMGRSPTDGNQLAVAHNLGPYRIAGLLGRSGMGEVYRAQTRPSLANRLNTVSYINRTLSWDAELESIVASLTPAEIKAALVACTD